MPHLSPTQARSQNEMTYFMHALWYLAISHSRLARHSSFGPDISVSSGVAAMLQRKECLGCEGLKKRRLCRKSQLRALRSMQLDGILPPHQRAHSQAPSAGMGRVCSQHPSGGPSQQEQAIQKRQLGESFLSSSSVAAEPVSEGNADTGRSLARLDPIQRPRTGKLDGYAVKCGR
jgi:hypothetical protein